MSLGDLVRRSLQGRGKCLVISGVEAAGAERLERPLFELRRAGIQCIAGATSKRAWCEPTTVDKLAEVGRRAGVQFVVAAGGGTVVETAKAVAAAIPARGQSCAAWLEGGGASGSSVQAAPLPLVLVPTTLGGGLASGSPLTAVHMADEQLLSAPRWQAAQKAGFTGAGGAAAWAHGSVLVHLDGSLLPTPSMDSNSDALGLALLSAHAVDLLVARAVRALPLLLSYPCFPWWITSGAHAPLPRPLARDAVR